MRILVIIEKIEIAQVTIVRIERGALLSILLTLKIGKDFIDNIMIIELKF